MVEGTEVWRTLAPLTAMLHCALIHEFAVDNDSPNVKQKSTPIRNATAETTDIPTKI